MAEVDETRLPGVGIRHDFVTASGWRLGVISHFGGRRSLLVYDRDDPDSCRVTVPLDEEDAQALGDVLGVTHVTDQLAEIQQSIEGLSIDWIPVEEGSPYAGRPLGDTTMRTRTGVSIVALVSDDETVPSPSPDHVLEPDSTAVVVGTPEGIRKALALLRGE